MGFRQNWGQGTAPADEALKLQRALPDGVLKIVMTGERKIKTKTLMSALSPKVDIQWTGRDVR